MIRDACAAALAVGALAWAARLLWLGPPVETREEEPLVPWVDASCGAQIEGALDELAPKLAPKALDAPSPTGIAAARATLAETGDGELGPAGLALARCLDSAARHGIEARWSRPLAGGSELEAEFRAPAEIAVAWWEDLLLATAGSPLEPRACRWSVLGPIASDANAEIVGRLRLHIAALPPAPRVEGAR
ncbi:MAG: hypothetical protein IPN34_08245 [Planctomycetes bacterium]|nr:hypothetical protein [Planctomycetota bacterium]